MAELKVGTKCVHRTEPGVTATIIYIDDKGVTILVDGYAASDFYSFREADKHWEVIE